MYNVDFSIKWCSVDHVLTAASFCLAPVRVDLKKKTGRFNCCLLGFIFLNACGDGGNVDSGGGGSE